MSLNSTPSADRIHISIFGDTNAGKSSLINAITGQNLAIVSDISGTTTDPVLKSMELLPLGPVTIIDTPGLDDDSILGKLRTEKTIQILNKTDIAVIVCDICVGFSKTNLEILIKILGKKIPFVIVGNKADLFDEETTKESFYSSVVKQISSNVLTSNSVSSINDIIFTFSTNIDSVNKLKERIASLLPEKLNKKPIVSDLINENDTVICVVPVDEAAPKGRLILPQQQTIRDIIDKNAYAFVTKDTTLSSALNTLNVKPKLVIVIDSLASKSIERISSTIQIADTGIVPGAGVGNARNELSEATLGIPVIAIGVPMVVETATLVNDALYLFIKKLQEEAKSNNELNELKEKDNYNAIKEALNPQGYNMIVTPKEIDDLIENMKDVIARGINYAV